MGLKNQIVATAWALEILILLRNSLCQEPRVQLNQGVAVGYKRKREILHQLQAVFLVWGKCWLGFNRFCLTIHHVTPSMKGAGILTGDGEVKAGILTGDGEVKAGILTGDGEVKAGILIGDGEVKAGILTGDGEPPEPPPPWNRTFYANKFAPSCVQLTDSASKTPSAQDEDCLYLNIYVPEKNINRRETSVLVFIEGGGFVSGSVNNFPAQELAAEGVIVVSINYRLNVFGEPPNHLEHLSLVVSKVANSASPPQPGEPPNHLEHLSPVVSKVANSAIPPRPGEPPNHLEHLSPVVSKVANSASPPEFSQGGSGKALPQPFPGPWRAVASTLVIANHRCKADTQPKGQPRLPVAP
uniref:Carboxylesterase type B domain-containing protein n=1 Tax=Timema cristinae TaxID=61476 RepID=A0A7R9D3N2_TIMCR|nr:unnamed protein product [Timema cristinae]